MKLLFRILTKLKRLRRGREILFFFNTQLGVGRILSKRITKTLKIGIYPKEYFKRKFLAYRLGFMGSPNSGQISIDVNTGYAITNVNKLAWGCEALESSLSIYKTYMQQPVDNCMEGQKSFRPNILRTHDLVNRPALLRFAASPSIIEPVSRYLRTMPVIGSINIWVSKTNDLMQQSQLFHIDQEDYRQVKLFLLISDVHSENGPLTVVPALESMEIYRRAENPIKRIPEALVNNVCPSGERQELTGVAGTVGLIDTARCYHMGSRTRKGNRVVLMVQYLPFHCVMEPNNHVLQNIRAVDLKGEGWPSYCPELLLRSRKQEIIWRQLQDETGLDC